MHVGSDVLCISASVQIASVFLTQAIHPHNDSPVSVIVKLNGVKAHTVNKSAMGSGDLNKSTKRAQPICECAFFSPIQMEWYCLLPGLLQMLETISCQLK